MWDPFWFMHEMFDWARSVGAPSFDVKETGDAYIYKVKLTVPGQADVARVRRSSTSASSARRAEGVDLYARAGFSTAEYTSNDGKPSWISSGCASTPSAYPITSRLG